MAQCTGCQIAISSEETMLVINKQNCWHAKCLRCFECKHVLEDSCFMRNNKMFCLEDFYRKFGQQCPVCGDIIKSKQSTRQINEHYFHESCFVCAICTIKINTGDSFHTVDDKLLLCPQDYKSLKRSYEVMMGIETTDDAIASKKIKKESQNLYAIEDRNIKNECKEPDDLYTRRRTLSAETKFNPRSCGPQNSNGDYDDFFGLSLSLPASPELDELQSTDCINNYFNSADPTNDKDDEADEDKSERTDEEGDLKNDLKSTVNGKKRGPRTTIKAKQLEMLKSAFIATPKPTRHIREQLASETGLNMRVIQVWFQNRRSKERRMRQVSLVASRRHWALRNYPNPNGLSQGYDLADVNMIRSAHPNSNINFINQPLSNVQDVYDQDYYNQHVTNMQNSNASYAQPYHQNFRCTQAKPMTTTPSSLQSYGNSQNYRFMNSNEGFSIDNYENGFNNGQHQLFNRVEGDLLNSIDIAAPVNQNSTEIDFNLFMNPQDNEINDNIV